MPRYAAAGAESFRTVAARRQPTSSQRRTTKSRSLALAMHVFLSSGAPTGSGVSGGSIMEAQAGGDSHQARPIGHPPVAPSIFHPHTILAIGISREKVYLGVIPFVCLQLAAIRIAFLAPSIVG